MYRSFTSAVRGKTLIVFAVLFLLTAAAVSPVFFVSEANVRGRGLNRQTKAQDDALPNYDIRSDKAAHQKIAELRGRHNRTAAAVADKRDEAVQGEDELRAKLPSVKVVYGAQSRMPEVIAPDEKQGKARLSSAVGGSRAETVRQFVLENQGLFGIDAVQAGSLKVAADYKNPEGGMSFVELEQEINGVPVFAGELRAGFAANGDLVRVINNLAAGADAGVSAEFGDPSAALATASGNIGREGRFAQLAPDFAGKVGNKVAFGEGDFAPTAEKIYFPTEPGVLVPAWRVLLWEPVNAFYVIVDAESQTVLWRKNITEDQTQPATYSVYSNANSMVNVADNPAPLTPGPIDPFLGSQGTITGRTSLSLIGNEGVYAFNNLGWLTNNVNVLDGNAVQAGPDRDCVVNTSTGQCQIVTDQFGNQINLPNDGIDANVSGAAFRDFSFNYNPGPGNPAPGGEPLPAGASPGVCVVTPAPTSDFQKGAVTQLFYITNQYHDEMYRLGFTEAARNFQNDNFGRGGVGNDRVSAQAQDCSGVNNANFSSPTDGTRGRMQMYSFNQPTPDRDGSLDADIVIHELTHGTSNRLHGNSSGLSTNMARGMGEGWSDFYAHAMLSEPTDPINGIYSTGGYATFLLRGPGFTANYYYGIRRFPKAVIAFTGGPNNRPHNPLTFADIDATQINLGNGAFSPAFSTTADQVHAAGEVWSSMLWEVRAKYVQRLGWEVGNRRILQHVTDGMKLSPLNPTFVDARDAIVAAALAGGTGDDVRDIWAGFALRGLGASAVVTNPGASGGGATRVTEAFDLPNLQQPGITVSDSTGDNDGGMEPGETIRITVPLKNLTGNTATNVSAQIVGASTIAYGTIGHNGEASNQFNFTIPANTACGSVLNLTINVNSSLGPVSFARSIRIGVGTTAISQNFDSVTAPAIPAGWTAAAEAGGIAFVTSTNFADSAPNAAYARNPATVGGGTTLTSPAVQIQSAASTVSFRHRFDTEPGWDGGVLELSLNGGAFQDIITSGGTWVTNGYNGVLGTGTNNPLNGRNAWSGGSGGFITSTVIVPASAVGQNVQFRWRFGADDNTVGAGPNPGWYIDNVSVVSNYSCSFTAFTRDIRGDFDGDDITDFSVYRPAEGNWYVFGSQQGFFAYGWGGGQDIPVPADYDRDGKTDAAVYRPNDPQGGVFYLLKSNGFVFEARLWGGSQDKPVVGDYDGDTIPDAAVYRESDGGWYVLKTTGGFEITSFGQAGDIAVPGDFDGDGRHDLTVFRDGLWITRKSAGGFQFESWGVSTDQLVPADYDGDNKDDHAVFRAQDGVFWIKRSSDGGIEPRIWGQAGDIGVPGNYDLDNKADVAVYRNGEWYALKTGGGTGAAYFGGVNDIPLPKRYLP